MKPSVNKKTNVFGRELDAKAMNKLIVSGAFLWMIFGMAFVYIYVKYIYGRRNSRPNITSFEKKLIGLSRIGKSPNFWKQEWG